MLSSADEERRGLNIATVRVFHVLASFALDRPEFGVTELSEKLGLTKNMVHRALVTLVHEGLLVRDSTGTRYELGYGALRLQNPNCPVPDFRILARSTQEELHALTGGTTQLSIRTGDNQVVIDGVEAHGPNASRPRIGCFFPLHASAPSRAILSCLKDSEIEDYLRRNAPLKRFTEFTLVMHDDIMAEVRKVRERGYAEPIGDYFRISTGFSFPITGSDGYPHGAITVGAPESVFSKKRAQELLPAMLECIGRLRRECALYDAR